MTFYSIDNALQEAINAADKPVRLKIEIEMDGHFQSVFEQDIIEANFYSIKEAAGGVSSRGDVLLDNNCGLFSNCGGTGAGLKVKISFSVGEGLPYFNRFIFYVDDKGIQDIKGNGRKKYIMLGLRDLSYKLRKSDNARDWTSPAVFTYSVVCDKTQAEKSLVHGIAQRAGLEVSDIDCSTIPVSITFVQLKRNIWSELSSLAMACRCHLECAVEKPLIFAHSPYQVEQLTDNEVSHTFTGEDIFYLRKTARADYYRNTIRLKINLPVALEYQEIWQYDDSLSYYILIDEKIHDVIFVDELETQDDQFFGKPIIYDLNRSCFVRDDDQIAKFGAVALNVTGSYFSEFDFCGMPHYEDWARRELAERLKNNREFTVKTHKAFFNSRVGANVKINLKNEELAGTINALSFRYKRDRAFVTSFRITEYRED